MVTFETWLSRARSALEVAKMKIIPLVCYEDLCFQAQQAAEKALKGLLIYYGEEPEFTHNIDRIIKALLNHTEVPDDIQKAAKLTDYATFTRYPNECDDITKEEYDESIIIATDCLNWVEQKINDSPEKPVSI
jgi:HEPN domain-containing protein